MERKLLNRQIIQINYEISQISVICFIFIQHVHKTINIVITYTQH